MVTDFQDKLRKIRESKSRESQERRAMDSMAHLEHYHRVEFRHDRRELIEQVIEEYGAKFMAELPSFSRSKSFFEGKYKIEFSNDDLRVGAEGSLDKFFSRITFLLDIPSDSDVIHVRCKTIVLNQDLDSTATSVPFEGELEAFRKFSEEQFFQFADAYFTASPDTPSPVAP
jgi:hypothetical protein